MKFTITFKDPDGVYECIQDAVVASLDATGLDDQEREAIIESRIETVQRGLSKWLRCNEYVDVEFDTDTMTARVLEAR